MGISKAIAVTLAAQLSNPMLPAGAIPSPRSLPISSTQPEPSRACAVPRGWEGVAEREPRFVIFGEVHGTQQAPAFIGDLSCALAAQGKRILVAVEHPSDLSAAYQHAWQLPETAFVQALSKAGWAQMDDGTGSEAMMALLVRLHQLARRGAAIDVTPFNGMKNEAQAQQFAHLPGQGPHEAAQADNILRAASSRPYDYALVLVGNVHARKRPVHHSGVTFDPMARHLARHGRLVTLDMETAGGTAWSCQIKPDFKPQPGTPVTSDAVVCGPHAVGRTEQPDGPPFIALTDPPPAHHAADYDGTFWLGRVRSSPPAVTPD